MLMVRRRGIPAARLTLALVLGGVLAPRVAAVAQSIPARLTDAEFWKLSVDFSEPDGYFRSENLLSNETTFQYVIPELQKIIKPGGVYLGVAPEQNFTYIVALQPAIVFICDIRRGNLLEHLMYKALMELSDNRADFLSRLFSRPRPAGLDANSTADALFAAFDTVAPDTLLYHKTFNAIRDHLVKDHGFALSETDFQRMRTIFDAFYDAGPELNYSYPNGGGGGGFGGRGMPNYYQLMVQTDGAGVHRSYLATEAGYRWLRDFESRNLIVPVMGNFGTAGGAPGPHALRSIGQWVRDHGAKVTAFYLSNVEQYLFQDGIAGNFYDNVATFPLDSTSTFIRSISGRGGFTGRGGGNLGNVISSMQEQIKAYKEGKINTWADVGMISH